MDARSLLEIDGAKVRALRMTQFFTQGELANLAHVSRETIAKLEADKRPFSKPRTIRDIAHALGVEPRELLKDHATE